MLLYPFMQRSFEFIVKLTTIVSGVVGILCVGCLEYEEFGIDMTLDSAPSIFVPCQAYHQESSFPLVLLANSS